MKPPKFKEIEDGWSFEIKPGEIVMITTRQTKAGEVITLRLPNGAKIIGVDEHDDTQTLQ
jgi:hypothetical protein